MCSFVALSEAAGQTAIVSMSVVFNREVPFVEEDVLSLVPFKVGDTLNPIQLAQAKQDIGEFFEIRGIDVDSVDLDIVESPEGSRLRINVLVAPPVLIREFEINVDHTAYAKDLSNYFLGIEK